MAIEKIKLSIAQRGPFDDAGDVSVQMEFDEQDQPKVYLEQMEGGTAHQVFLGDVHAVMDLIMALKFVAQHMEEEEV